VSRDGADYGAAICCFLLVVSIAWPLLLELRDGRRRNRRP
jgi:hypothetical protein